jgi:hypothetical protein
MKVRAIYLPLALSLAGCASTEVRMLNEQSTYSAGSCKVEVFQTKSSAEEHGKIQELCIVEGSTAMSFKTGFDGAIENTIKGVCRCGTNKAYVQSRHADTDMGFKGPWHVTLVGFKRQQNE